MTIPPPPDPQPLKEKINLQSVLVFLSTRKGMRLLGLISLALLVLAGAGIFLLSKYGSPAGLFKPELTPPTSLSELATQYPELGAVLQDPKLDSVYKDFLVAYQEGGLEAALELARSRGLVNDQDELRLTLELDTSDSQMLTSQLEAVGIQVTAASENLIDVSIPLSLIEIALASEDPGGLFQDISGLEHVTRIRLPRRSIQDVEDVKIESLAMINAQVWQNGGFTGKGIKIGILDMGFNRYKEFLGSELPSSVTAQSFIAGREIDRSETEHGTAVAEVIHDIAPEAELFLAAYETDAEQGAAVDWLVEQGVNIISHSAGSIYGPMDGKGREARMVDQVVARGILWVNSAGNMGQAHYRGSFTDADGDGYHEFSPGDELMSFTPKGMVTLTLNWDAWDTGDQDYDLYVVDGNGATLVSSENRQTGAGDDAAEIISYLFGDSGPYFVAFRANRITQPAVLDFYIYNSKIEYFSPEYSITTPADAVSSLTVGATSWPDDLLENYSSQGPTHDERKKPDLCAPTGLSSAVYDGIFYGTSASAPHVSASAALAWQAYPELSVAELVDFLKMRALDLGPSGTDNQYGFGRLWLGEPPAIVLAPSATETPRLPEPTSTLEASATSAPATAVSTRAPTPSPLSPDRSLWELPLGLMAACVVVPALLGLAGIALLGGIWYWSRSRAAKSIPRPAGVPAQANPALSQQPVTGGSDILRLCTNCGRLNRPGARFCSACGQPLVETRFCTNCGQPLRANSKFCPRCGSRS
ncbi:MAG: S8 family serine peptidase [Anaerolineales bacterium]|nr:S8 family serine peptidase [Anaerolineales bacterium]